MKTIAMFFVMLVGLVGCSKAAELGTVTEPQTAFYVVETTAHFSGQSALTTIRCHEGDMIVNATCGVDGGKLTTETAAYGGWECGAEWYDTTAGGTLSAHLDCSHQ